MKTRIGHRLLAIREGLNLTQVQMAERLNIPEATYGHYERNETQVEYEKIVKFAQLLNVPVQDLMPETVSVTSNYHNTGQGGGIVFGNQYFYVGDSAVNQALSQENKELRDALATMQKQMQYLFDKLAQK
jgi:transcriptional regulator with XRE-family HTH domain